MILTGVDHLTKLCKSVYFYTPNEVCNYQLMGRKHYSRKKYNKGDIQILAGI